MLVSRGVVWRLRRHTTPRFPCRLSSYYNNIGQENRELEPEKMGLTKIGNCFSIGYVFLPILIGRSRL